MCKRAKQLLEKTKNLTEKLTHRKSSYGRADKLWLDFSTFILVAVLVHSFYLFYVEPSALAEQEAAQANQKVPEQTIAIVLKDFEQELCLILGVWCIFLLIARHHLGNEDKLLIESDFTRIRQGTTGVAEIRENLSDAKKLVKQSLVLSAVTAALDAFAVNGSIEEAKSAALERCEIEEELIDSKLTTVRYILWAIPSIGFLGTVRGIGSALTRADEALKGDISGVASSLGIAFNSTFVALMVSLVLTLIASSLRGREQERIVSAKRFMSGPFATQLKGVGPSNGSQEKEA